MRHFELSSAPTVKVRGRAVNKAKSSFKKNNTKAAKACCVVFSARQPTQHRMVMLSKEQARSLLLAKRDAYLGGKLPCKASVVKSSIKKFVKMLNVEQVEA